MNAFRHWLIFGSYALSALSVVILLPVLFSGVSIGTSILIGLIVGLSGGLGHEIYMRRDAEKQNIRRMMTLKRAFDRTQADLQLARDETRRMFEVLEKGQMEIPKAEGPVEVKTDNRDMKEVAAEVRVLHSLVEQLYADGPPPDARSSDGAESDPGVPEKKTMTSSYDGATAGQVDQARLDEGPQLDTHPLPGTNSRKYQSQDTERSSPSFSAPRVVSRSTGNGTSQLDSRYILEVVREGLRQDRVDLYLQPIVSLPQRKRRYFECSNRIRAEDGGVYGPDTYQEMATAANLMTAIDNMLLFRCVQLLRKVQGHDFSAAFFCNISPYSLADRRFLRDFIDYMDAHQELAPSLILELAQGDLMAVPDALYGDLQRLSRMGYRFALDKVTDLKLDIRFLKERHFSFVKIDAQVILDHAHDSDGSTIRIIKQQLDEAGIDLIIDGIETELMLVELLDFHIDYGQGHLFGEPRISKEPPVKSRAI